MHIQRSLASPRVTPTAQAQAHKQRKWRQGWQFWVGVGPLLLGLLIFTYVPVIWGFILSFGNAQNTVFPTTFVGLQNYISMLTDSTFQHSLVTFAIFALFIVPTEFILALSLALLVNLVPRGKAFFRSVFFLPTACSFVAASLIWRSTLFNGLSSGAVNSLLHVFGIPPIAWISNTTFPWYWLVLVTVRLWVDLGFYMIIFLAGLQDIPRELYEAAQVDGAKRGWKTFRNITFPLLRNTSVLVVLLSMISAFQAFDEFYNVLSIATSGGGNASVAQTPLIYIYQVGFNSADYGRGTAGAFILTAIIVVVTIIQGRVTGFGRKDG